MVGPDVTTPNEREGGEQVTGSLTRRSDDSDVPPDRRHVPVGEWPEFVVGRRQFVVAGVGKTEVVLEVSQPSISIRHRDDPSRGNVDVDGQPQLGGHRNKVTDGRTRGPVEPADTLPVRVGPGPGVFGVDLEHDTTAGVVVEPAHEPSDVGDVVDDVVAHDHVRHRCCVGIVGPAANDGVIRDAPACRDLAKRLEHVLAFVNACGMRDRVTEPHRGGAAAAADVQDGAAVAERRASEDRRPTVARHP